MSAPSSEPARASVRPMREDDVAAAAELSARAFGWDVEQRERERPGTRALWLRRVGRQLDTDPGGAFVAELDGVLVGVAEAIVRESLWVLSLLAVDPHRQSAGAGHRLMAAALGYRGPAAVAAADEVRSEPAVPPGLIVASNDPRALRLYGRAGFELRPVFSCEGELRPELLPDVDGAFREIGQAELVRFETLTRAVRGAPWTAELAAELENGSTAFALAGAGIVVVRSGGEGIWGLVAEDQAIARKLLVAGLGHCARLAGEAGRPQVSLRWLTAEQQWAISLLLELGLPLRADGALCVRGDPGSLYPFIPSGPYS